MGEAPIHGILSLELGLIARTGVGFMCGPATSISVPEGCCPVASNLTSVFSPLARDKSNPDDDVLDRYWRVLDAGEKGPLPWVTAFVGDLIEELVVLFRDNANVLSLRRLSFDTGDIPISRHFACAILVRVANLCLLRDLCFWSLLRERLSILQRSRFKESHRTLREWSCFVRRLLQAWASLHQITISANGPFLTRAPGAKSPFHAYIAFCKSI